MSEDLASGTGVTGADSVLLDAVRPLLAEHAELERALSEPDLHADPARARAVGRRYAELGQVVEAYGRLLAAAGDEAAARDLAEDDEDFAAELPAIEEAHLRAREHLRRLLVPRDPDDDRDVILEIKAGEGGGGGALFAGDLPRRYLRYAERQG